jgi:hypothetical protein
MTEGRNRAAGACACALLALAGYGWAVPAGSVEAAARAMLPPVLQGVWFTDDRDGKRQCALYRKDANDERAFPGQLLIAANEFHEFAEYGEGNRNVVTAVEVLADGRWRVHESIFIEGDDDGTPGTHVFELKGKRLRLSYQAADEASASLETDYLRCK